MLISNYSAWRNTTTWKFPRWGELLKTIPNLAGEKNLGLSNLCQKEDKIVKKAKRSFLT